MAADSPPAVGSGDGSGSHPADRDALTSGCQEGPDALCLVEERFHVTGRYRSPGGDWTTASAVQLTDLSGYLWFFGQDNVEVVFKMLDACAPPYDRFWFFGAGMTDVEVELVVTDTVTGIANTYRNDQGTAFTPILDTGAFATCSE